MIVNLGNDVFVYNQTDRYLYDKISSKKTFVEYFGLESFLYRNLKDHYFVNEAKAEEEIKKIEDEIEAIKTSMKLSETFERMSKGVNP